MSGFLVDTNVLSEFSRSGIQPDARVRRWIESVHPGALFGSVLSFGEIRKGIDLLPMSKKRRDLEQSFETDLSGWFAHNLLPVTRAISQRWGTLAAMLQLQGKQLAT